MWTAAVDFGYANLLLGVELKNKHPRMEFDTHKANLLAGTALEGSMGKVFNVSRSGTTSLIRLYWMISGRLGVIHRGLVPKNPVYTIARERDIWHSQADLSKIGAQPGYEPTYPDSEGLGELAPWVISLPSQS